VFVHGIRGDPEKTWKAKRSGTFWPETILPKEIPEARVLTWGYDAGVFSLTGSVSSNGLDNHAQNFLSALASCRNGADEVSAPFLPY